MKFKLLPIFDNINQLHKNHDHAVLPDIHFQNDFNYCLNFLKSYTGSQGTFNSYRRETERLLQWSWLVKNRPLIELKKDDIEQYIHFCQNPPKSWISLKKVPRFIEKEGTRVPNKEWRPFVVTLSKVALKNGHRPEIDQFNLSQGAIQEIFAILSTLFNFLIAEEYLVSNPIALIRQKSKFIRKRQQTPPVRRLSIVQWNAVLHAAETLATESPEKHEITRFMLSILFGMYLRISELAASPRWIPSMNDFAKDSNGHWWFTTVGKGNKERIIPCNSILLTKLLAYKDAKRHAMQQYDAEVLFVSEKGKKLYPKSVYNSVRKYLDPATTIEKRSPHVLRHTFATHLMNEGADLNAVKELLGHSSLAATQVYTHNTIEKLKDVFKKAHPKA